MEPQRPPEPARPQPRHPDRPHQPGHDRLVAHLPPADGPPERHQPDGNLRNHHPHRLLRRMAQGMGSLPPGQGRMGRRHTRHGRQSRLPADDDFPHRRTEHGLQPLLHGKQLSGPYLGHTGAFCQRHLRATLPQQLAHPQGHEGRRTDAGRRSRTRLVPRGRQGPTAGLPTWPSKSQARTPPTNGWNP